MTTPEIRRNPQKSCKPCIQPSFAMEESLLQFDSFTNCLSQHSGSQNRLRSPDQRIRYFQLKSAERTYRMIYLQSNSLSYLVELQAHICLYSCPPEPYISLPASTRGLLNIESPFSRQCNASSGLCLQIAFDLRCRCGWRNTPNSAHSIALVSSSSNWRNKPSSKYGSTYLDESKEGQRFSRSPGSNQSPGSWRSKRSPTFSWGGVNGVRREPRFSPFTRLHFETQRRNPVLKAASAISQSILLSSVYIETSVHQSSCNFAELTRLSRRLPPPLSHD